MQATFLSYTEKGILKNFGSCSCIASFPGSSPAFCLYSMRQKPGEEPGNEAIPVHVLVIL